MHESDRRLLNVLYRIVCQIYHYSGAEYVYRKAVPGKKPQQHPLPTLPLWLIGIYIALFGLASQRYENRVDIIERKVTSIYTRLTPITSAIIQLPPVVTKTKENNTIFIQNLSEYNELRRKKSILSIPDEEYKTLKKRYKLMLAEKEILSKIPAIQNYPCPVVPSIFRVDKTILSLFRSAVHKETVEELKELIVDSKKDLKGAYLSEANLRQADLLGANLEGAHLREVNLEGADLQQANLEGANLFKANLKEAKLQRANLKEAKLLEVNLEGASLFKANLFKANLWEANLEGANLEGAGFEGANLEGADLRGALGLTIDQLSKVKTLYKAKLDSELMEQVRAKYPHLLEESKPDE